MPSQKFFFSFAEVVVGFVNLGDCCNKCISGLKRVLTIEGVRRWQIVLRVDENHHRSSTWITRNSAQGESIRLDCYRFVLICLQQTRGREESNFDSRDIERRDLDHSQVAIRVVHCPRHLTLSLDLQSTRYSLELSDGARVSHGVLKVFRVRRDGNTCSRIPNDGSTVCRSAEGVSHSCRCL